MLSGDLTQRAKPAQFGAARAFVDGLGVPVLAVPGNHDVPLYRVWERALSPYGAYRTHFAADLEPVFRDPSWWWRASTVHSTGPSRTAVCACAGWRRSRTLMRAAPVPALKVAVIHHPLVRLPGFPGDLPATNARATLEVLSAAGVDLVLGGHLHQGFAGRSEEFHAAPGVVLCYAGTASSRRGRGGERGLCSCNWIEWDGGELRVTRMVCAADADEFLPAESHHFPRAVGRG